MPTRTLFVPEGLDGARIDAALSKMLGLSRSFAASIVASGGVLLNGSPVSKSERVSADSVIVAIWEDRTDPVIVPNEVPDFKVLYDDDDIVVVDKPSGVAAHPSLGWDGPTVPGALLAAGFRIATSGAAERAGIVHRLDVGTSGVMVVAKSEMAYSRLKHAFKDREVEKTYHALVQGHPDPFSGTIDAPIGRHPSHSWKFAVRPEGKDSITHYRTLEAFPGATLLEVQLETGRTHQIRVHMSAQRHPCVGDPLYGCDPKLADRLSLQRQWLHAKELAFEHPRTNELVRFSSDYPEDLSHALEVLANS